MEKNNLYGLKKKAYDKFEKNPKDAIKLYRKVLKTQPRDLDALINLGGLLSNTKRYRSALVYLDKALKIKSKEVLALENKAITLSHLGNYKEALVFFNKVLKINPNYKHSLINKSLALQEVGQQLYEKKKYKASLRYFDEALEINPIKSENCDLLSDKGISLAKLGKNKEAMRCFNKALRITPRCDNALENKIILLKNTNRFIEALALTNKLIRFYPQEKDYKKIRKSILEKIKK